MKNFVITLNDTPTESEKETLDQLFEKQLDNLRKLGFEVAFQKKTKKTPPHLKIVYDDEVYMDSHADGQIDFGDIRWLSELVERALVQINLDSMRLRLACLNWQLVPDDCSLFKTVGKDKLKIMKSSGEVEEYPLTNAGVLKLSLDLNRAEVDSILGNDVRLFQMVGWRIYENEHDGYTIMKPDGDFELVSKSLPEQARAAVEKARKTLSEQNSAAEELRRQYDIG